MPTISHSPFLPTILSTLKHGCARQVHEAFQGPLSDVQGEVAMQWLRANRPAIADQVLCLLYDLWWHEESGQSAGLVPAGKWFISTSVDSTIDAGQVPLGNTAEEVCAQAVKTLQLEDAFFGRVAEPA